MPKNLYWPSRDVVVHAQELVTAVLAELQHRILHAKSAGALPFMVIPNWDVKPLWHSDGTAMTIEVTVKRIQEKN